MPLEVARPRRARSCSPSQASSARDVGAQLELALAQRPPQAVLAGRADRDHAADAGLVAAAWIATKPPMLEPRTQTRRASTSSRSASSAAIVVTSPSAAGRHHVVAVAVAALVVGERRPAGGGAGRAKSAWFSFAEPAPWRITIAGHGGGVSGSQSQYGPALVTAAFVGRLRGRQPHRPDGSRARRGASGRAPVTMASDGRDDHQRLARRPTRSRARRSIPGAAASTSAGHLEIGGCDVVELAREFGTPAYLYAPDDIRARARAYLDAFDRAATNFEVVFASKAAPITAIYEICRELGPLRRRRLRRRAAHGAARRLRPGADLYARQQQDRGRAALRVRRRRRLPGAATPSTRSPAPTRCSTGPQRVLMRLTPGVKALDPLLHPDRPARLEVRLRPRRRPRRARGRGGAGELRASSSSACTRTSARRSSSSSPTCGRSRRWPSSPATSCRRSSTSAAASGSPTPPTDEPPSIDRYVEVKVEGIRKLFDRVPRILIEPGRSLVGNAGMTMYTGRHGQGDPRRAHLRRGRRRHVRQPAADALRRRATRR